MLKYVIIAGLAAALTFMAVEFGAQRVKLKQEEARREAISERNKTDEETNNLSDGDRLDRLLEWVR
jgi:hypothetical protein